MLYDIFSAYFFVECTGAYGVKVTVLCTDKYPMGSFTYTDTDNSNRMKKRTN